MKYMGGKTKIAKYIVPIMLHHRQKQQYFVEPFVGGCNITDKISGNRIAADINPYLIAMWKGLQTNNNRISYIPKEIYNYYRTLFKARYDRDFEIMFNIGWIGFMASFNGRFFDGGYSGHNVKGRDYVGEQIRNTESQLERIQEVEFIYSDYSELTIPINSIIYCDIPYQNTQKYIYSSDFDYVKFWNWAKKKTTEGHIVFISEYSAPSEFIPIWEKTVTNSLSSYKTYHPAEKLFVHQSLYNLF